MDDTLGDVASNREESESSKHAGAAELLRCANFQRTVDSMLIDRFRAGRPPAVTCALPLANRVSRMLLPRLLSSPTAGRRIARSETIIVACKFSASNAARLIHTRAMDALCLAGEHEES